MSTVIQQINHADELVGVVIGDQATIFESVPEGALRDVHAKCLYAMEILAGDRPGPYTDLAADQFATQVRAQRAVAERLDQRP